MNHQNRTKIVHIGHTVTSFSFPVVFVLEFNRRNGDGIYCNIQRDFSHNQFNKKVKQKQICIQIGLSNITPNSKYTFLYFEKDKDRLCYSDILRDLKKLYLSIYRILDNVIRASYCMRK